MKALRKLSTTLFLLCLAGMAKAQDVIVKTDNSTILSKVLEISNTEIKYKKWSNQEGPTYFISLSEVLRINYQNGEVEAFSSNSNQLNFNSPQQTSNNRKNRGTMTVAGSGIRLKLDGRKLSHEEVRHLVGEEYYQLYRQGIKDSNIEGFSMLTCLLSGVFGWAMVEVKDDIGNYPLLAPGVVCIGICVVSGIVCFSFAGGQSKMERVAHAYNNGLAGNFSFKITPTMMNTKTPQSNNNYGLGLTFCMNF